MSRTRGRPTRSPSGNPALKQLEEQQQSVKLGVEELLRALEHVSKVKDKLDTHESSFPIVTSAIANPQGFYETQSADSSKSEADGYKSTVKTLKESKDLHHVLNETGYTPVLEISSRVLEAADQLVKLQEEAANGSGRRKQRRGVSPESNTPLSSSPPPEPVEELPPLKRRRRGTAVPTDDTAAAAAAAGTTSEVNLGARTSSPHVPAVPSPYDEPLAVGSQVAYRVHKQRGGEDEEWIQCQVIRVISEGTRYEVQDPEPDENNNPGMRYKASIRDLIHIPDKKRVSELGTFPPGTTVLARYPETTTFYRAEVISTRRDGSKCRLSFEGEDEEGKETEVERRLVLPLSRH